ncbi:recombination mediator RecR [Rickettsia montanensis]|uniref:Recombination protein RecR n=1 Tax=Rickettsia montanensis (strain OSU 85-930) TaxID=1105114 RepID=H8KA31_RICMS|nr:recombination mediator RecR [Rickettsia montanensis]AFC73008.1 recombination protein RecR [Rickettsia montanensis str. OSU 85-930]
MNETNDNDIDQLIYLFSKLPGLGSRSARRIALYLLQDKDVRLKSLINNLVEIDKKIVKCEICGNMDTENICRICSSEYRDKSIIAIVETVAELWAMERSGNFKGLYHVLGHNLSAASRQNPSILRLPELLERCFAENIKEVIIATNSTLEGQTTAYFITEYLKEHPAKISRLASGIPIGGELDYLDEGTVSAAINLRQPFE